MLNERSQTKESTDCTISCLWSLGSLPRPQGAVRVVTLAQCSFRWDTWGWLGVYQTCISRKGFPGGSATKNVLANAGDAGDAGSIAGSGRSPGWGNGNPLQYSCLENFMDGGAWRLQSMGSQRVRHNSATNTFFTFTLAVAVGLRLPNICLFFFFNSLSTLGLDYCNSF